MLLQAFDLLQQALNLLLQAVDFSLCALNLSLYRVEFVMESFCENLGVNGNFCSSSSSSSSSSKITDKSTRRTQVRVNKVAKEMILRMMKNDSTLRKISTATGLNIHTVQHRISKLENNPETKLTKVGKRANPNMKRRRKVELSIAANNSFKAIGIVESVPENLKCHPSLIRDLKAIGYIRKRLTTIAVECNSARVISLRLVYCNCLNSISIKDCDLVFIDEKGFNLYMSNVYRCTQLIQCPFIK